MFKLQLRRLRNFDRTTTELRIRCSVVSTTIDTVTEMNVELKPEKLSTSAVSSADVELGSFDRIAEQLF